MKKNNKIHLLVFGILCCFQSVHSQSLDSFLQLVVENNTELKAIEMEYESILAKKNQVSQLPNPQVGVSIPALRPETRLGPQVIMVSASQMFPWFGTLKSKEEVVIFMSKDKYEQLSVLKLELFYQVKDAYYQLYFLNKKQHVLKENLKLFEFLETISLAKVESGESTLADVLRVQTKLQELRQQLLIIENQKVPYQSKINELTNQSINNEINITDTLTVAPLEYDTASYRDKIKNHHPLITQINYKIEQSNAIMVMNNNMNKPTIGVGLDYSLVNERIDANPINNGRDILIPKVMVTIPIYRKSYRAKIEEEELIQKSLELKKETIEDRMMNLLIKYKSIYENGLLEKELYQSQYNTIQSAYEVLLAEYSSTGKGFEELLMVQNQLLNYELGMYQAELKANIAQANIEQVTKF